MKRFVQNETGAIAGVDVILSGKILTVLHYSSLYPGNISFQDERDNFSIAGIFVGLLFVQVHLAAGVIDFHNKATDEIEPEDSIKRITFIVFELIEIEQGRNLVNQFYAFHAEGCIFQQRHRGASLS